MEIQNSQNQNQQGDQQLQKTIQNKDINIESKTDNKDNQQQLDGKQKPDEQNNLISNKSNYELQKGQLFFNLKDAAQGTKCCCCKGPIGAPKVNAFNKQLTQEQRIQIKQFVFLYNPSSANGECQINVNKLVAFCKKQNINITTVQSKSLQHFNETVANFDYQQRDNILFICGGDGSIFNAINIIAEKNLTNIALGIIPFGSGNDFARSLNFFKDQFLQRFEQIYKAPYLKQIDIIQAKLIDLKGNAQIKYFHANFGYGYPGRVNDTANRKCQCFKGLRYKVSALQAIFQFKDDVITLEIDNKQILQNQAVKFIMAFNTQHTGGGMRLAPYSQIDDGLIDVLIMRINSRCQFIKLFDAAQKDGLAIYQSGIEYYRGATVKIQGQIENALELDGETYFAKDVELNVINNLINIVC